MNISRPVGVSKKEIGVCEDISNCVQDPRNDIEMCYNFSRVSKKEIGGFPLVTLRPRNMASGVLAEIMSVVEWNSGIIRLALGGRTTIWTHSDAHSTPARNFSILIVVL